MIRIIKPFVYGLYLWVRHFVSEIDSDRNYLWHYLSNDYIIFAHTVALIKQGSGVNYKKFQQVMKAMESLSDLKPGA
jgi:hypothetical protein